MYKPIRTLLLISIIFISGFIIYSRVNSNFYHTPLNIPHQPHYWLTVLLIPLDSRPPCTQFVQQLADLAGIQVVLPEESLLGKYKNPGDAKALRAWLKNEIKRADAAIVSIDMLIHGGLLASRLSVGSTEDVEEVINLLDTIHKENPNAKLYAFTIIPRLLLADNSSMIEHQKSLAEYSTLKDQISTFENPLDIKKVSLLEKKLPLKGIEYYLNLYEKNVYLTQKLVEMANEGVFTAFVVGQDDGQAFGIPNIHKQYLNEVSKRCENNRNIFVTRGTDEVALTLLGMLANDFLSSHPKIHVIYSTPEVPNLIMPYMPHSISKTVQEKINLAGCLQIDIISDADFVLYIHAGTANTKATELATASDQIKQLLSENKQVALVDLSTGFSLEETLLPTLLKNNVPITQLVSYAGWNTTSNSIGTVITQGCLFVNSKKNEKDFSQLLMLYRNNLQFLIGRILDDLYYQKDIYPKMSKQLQLVNINPYEIGKYYPYINHSIQGLITLKSSQLTKTKFSEQPFRIENGNITHILFISDLKAKTILPWDRTFEIKIQPSIELSEINKRNSL